MTIQSFVFENTEVVKTGRTAKKELRSGKVDILYEITPKQSTTGVWRKWAREDDLFLVEDTE